jgi:hypothetical protein
MCVFEFFVRGSHALEKVSNDRKNNICRNGSKIVDESTFNNGLQTLTLSKPSFMSHFTLLSNKILSKSCKNGHAYIKCMFYFENSDVCIITFLKRKYVHLK